MTTLELQAQARVDIEALTKQVTGHGTVDASAVALIKGLADQIIAASNNPSAIEALGWQLRGDCDAVAASILANTKAAPGGYRAQPLIDDFRLRLPGLDHRRVITCPRRLTVTRHGGAPGRSGLYPDDGDQQSRRRTQPRAHRGRPSVSSMEAQRRAASAIESAFSVEPSWPLTSTGGRRYERREGDDRGARRRDCVVRAGHDR